MKKRVVKYTVLILFFLTFLISLISPIISAAGTLTIPSPRGGETFYREEPITNSWTFSNYDGSDILLAINGVPGPGNPNGGTQFTQISKCTNTVWNAINATNSPACSVSSGSGSLAWPIQGLFPGQYYQRVSCVPFTTCNVDVDSPLFNIAYSPLAPGVVLTASPTSITLGQSSTLTWRAIEATGPPSRFWGPCAQLAGEGLSTWSGPVPSSGSVVVSPTANTTYVLECIGNLISPYTKTPYTGGKSVTITVANAPPQTVTLTFSAWPLSIIQGQSSTLSWSSTGATSCTAMGGWSGTKPTSGTEVVTPTLEGFTTYILTCSGLTGSTTQLIPIYLYMPPILPSIPGVPTFSVQTSRTSDSDIEVTWGSSLDATSYRYSSGLNTGVNWNGQSGTSPNTFVILTSVPNGASILFCVWGVNANGESENGSCGSYTVPLLTDTTPPIVTITSPTQNQQLAAGTTQTTLSVTTNEAATCKYSTSNQIYDSMPNTFATTGNIGHSTILSGLSNGQSYTYYVRCNYAPGNKNSASSTISFSVNALIPVCTLTSASWSRNNSVEGDIVYLNVFGNNCNGKTISFDIKEKDFASDLLGGDDNVNVNPVNVVFSGASASATWVSEWQDDGIAGIAGDPEYYFTANVIGTNEQMQSGTNDFEMLHVSKFPTPPSLPTVTLSASPTSITAGQSSTLAWSSSNATSCTATGGWTGTKPISGTQSVSPTTNTTYNLNCTGAGGSTIRSITITVTSIPTPPSLPTVTLSASPTSITSGG